MCMYRKSCCFLLYYLPLKTYLHTAATSSVMLAETKGAAACDESWDMLVYEGASSRIFHNRKLAGRNLAAAFEGGNKLTAFVVPL